jgi:3-oxoacyl-[acyl-carrier-protein] synthase-1
MEASAVMELFGGEVYCSSTKPLTGHTLGAAGATEAALCWLLLEDEYESLVARHAFDGQLDPDIAPIRLSGSSESDRPIRYSMSNSFAFGGNNVSVVLGRSQID